LIFENPILGVGPYAGQVVASRYLELDQYRKGLHNLLFEISTGNGVPATVCYLAYFFIPWFAHFAIWRKKRIPEKDAILRAVNLATLCGIPGYWVASMFSSGALLEPSIDDDHHEDDFQEDLDDDSEMDEDFEEDEEQELVANR
jgi:O-antigen ligase